MDFDMSNIMNISSITNDNFITDIMQNVTIPNSTNDSTLKMSMNSTTTITTTTNNWLEFTSKIIAYYTPFIIFTGTIGNVLSILVFFRTKLKKLSSSYYLAALGASDTGYLFLNFLQWINVLGINIYNRELLCQLFTFLSNMFCMLSVWFVVAFTVERFIAVLYPLKRQTMCTVRRAKSILICLIIIGILHSSPLLLFAKATERRPGFMVCDIRPAFKDYMSYYNYYDTFIAFFLPLALIVVLNTFTTCTVWKLAGVRRTMTNHKRKRGRNSRDSTHRNQLNETGFMRCDIETLSETQKFTSCTHFNGHHSIKQSCPKTNRHRLSNSSQMKVTKMLLIVSTVFVLLNLPSYVLRVRAYLSDNRADSDQMLIIYQYISQQFFITNFGINFALYCMSGQNFRKEIIGLFRKSSANRSEAASQVTECLSNVGSNLSRKRMVTRNISWND